MNVINDDNVREVASKLVIDNARYFEENEPLAEYGIRYMGVMYYAESPEMLMKKMELVLEGLY